MLDATIEIVGLVWMATCFFYAVVLTASKRSDITWRQFLIAGPKLFMNHPDILRKERAPLLRALLLLLVLGFFVLWSGAWWRDNVA